MQAWVQWTNAHGGINGHPVKLIYMDDRSDPGQALADAHTLVQSDHVVAIVGQQAVATLAGFAGYLQQVKVPVIGGQDFNAPTNNPMMFMTLTSVVNLLAGQVKLVKFVKKERFGVVYDSQIAASAQSLPVLKQAAAAQGVDYALNVGVSASQPNYTAACLSAKNANVDVLALNVQPSLAPSIVSACTQQGYNPIYDNVVGASATELAMPGFEGAVGNVSVFPFFYKDPATADFHKAMDEYAPGIGSQMSTVSSISWTAGQLFAAAASRVKGTITAKSLLAALYTIKNDTLGGLTPPLSFGPAGKPNPPISCYYVVQVQSHQNTAPIGLRTECSAA